MERAWPITRASELAGFIGRAGVQALHLIYPPACLTCGVFVARQGSICPDCWNDVRFIERPFCEVTGAPFDHDRGEELVSIAAIADPPPYVKARAAVLHTGVARRLAQGLKYSDRCDLAPVMAGWMKRAGRELLNECDIIVPVPLHWGRRLSRRYNQSAELARAVAKLSGKPLTAGALCRSKPTRQQVGLGRAARQKNVKGAFVVRPVDAGRIAGRKILLVDDVLTTGATVNAATHALLRAGAEEVFVLTFARVASDGDETLYA